MPAREENNPTSPTLTNIPAFKVPTFSCIIPVYNQASTLRRAVESLWKQETCSDMEALIIDDGSTDDIRSVASSVIAQSPIAVRYIRARHQGVAAARNTGIRHARGSYIAFLDADDLWATHYLTRIREALERAAYDWIVVNNNFVDIKTDGILTILRQRERVFTPNLREQILLDNPIGSPGNIVIRRETMHQVGDFDPRFKRYEDWDYWIRLMACSSRGCSINEPLYQYVMNSTGLIHGVTLAELLRSQVAVTAKHIDRAVIAGPDLLGRMRSVLADFRSRCQATGGGPCLAFHIRCLETRCLVAALAYGIRGWVQSHSLKVQSLLTSLLIIYAWGILFVSLQPAAAFGHGSAIAQTVQNLLHIPAYAGLAVLLTVTAEAFCDVLKRAFWPTVLAVFTLTTVYGVMNEYVQASVPGRSFSGEDMLRNAIGAGLGLWLASHWLRPAAESQGAQP